MAVFEFVPTAFVTNGTDYSGAVTAIDEWPPVGGAGERLQTANTASGATRIGTVSFNLSTATNLDRGLSMVMAHMGNGAGGWSISAQLIVNSVNTGSPVVVSRPGASGLERYSFFYWPDSVLATVAANPSTVQVRWTATNLQGTNQQHLVHAVRMFVSPLTGAPILPSGIVAADVVAAWDLKSTASLWTDGVDINHLPDLIGSAHLIRTQGTMAFDDDDAVVAENGVPSDVLYGGQLPITMDDAWVIHVIKTVAVPAVEDHEPVMSNLVKDGGVDGSSVLFASINYKVLNTLDINEGPDGGWGVMADSGASHFFSDGWDDAGTAFPGDTWFLQIFNLRTAANERMYVTTAVPPAASDIVIDANGGGTTNKLHTVGLLNREDGSRGRVGRWAATYIFDGSLTVDEIMDYGDILGVYHGLWEGDEPVLDEFAFAEETDTAMGFFADSAVLDTYGFAAETDLAMSFDANVEPFTSFGYAEEFDAAMPFHANALIEGQVGGAMSNGANHIWFSRFNRCRCCTPASSS